MSKRFVEVEINFSFKSKNFSWTVDYVKNLRQFPIVIKGLLLSLKIALLRGARILSKPKKQFYETEWIHVVLKSSSYLIEQESNWWVNLDLKWSISNLL